jgi:hypothetical protein
MTARQTNVRQPTMPSWWAAHSPRVRRDEEYMVRAAIDKLQIRRRHVMQEFDLELRRLENMLP